MAKSFSSLVCLDHDNQSAVQVSLMSTKCLLETNLLKL